MDSSNYILLTVDVEDWFQVENFKPWIPFDTWDQRELRVERNVHRLLDLFDETEVRGQKTEDREQIFTKAKFEKNNIQQTTDHIQTNKVHATFFVLGWLAERLPHLIREIHSRGHEVASHGCNHKLSNQLSHEALKMELGDSKRILEDIIGTPIMGFRAPSFAISNYVMEQIAESNYFYDSSLNSFKIHNRYGTLDLSSNEKNGNAIKIYNAFYELPISNYNFSKIILPFGGGAYFRIIPLFIFLRIIKSILKMERTYLFYIHPWEIDPNQPKVNQASSFKKFRQYHNLNKNYYKLTKLIQSFRHCNFITCSQYIYEIEGSVEAGKLRGGKVRS